MQAKNHNRSNIMVEIYNDSGEVIRGIGIELAADAATCMPASMWVEAEQKQEIAEMVADLRLVKNKSNEFRNYIFALENLQGSIEDFLSEPNHAPDYVASFQKYLIEMQAELETLSKPFKASKKRGDMLAAINAKIAEIAPKATAKKASKK